MRRNLKCTIVCFLILFGAIFIALGLYAQEEKNTINRNNISYIQNNLLRVGVKLDWGGAISEIWYNGVNLIDDHDTGRLVQISLYADGEYYNYSNCMDPNWGWNPVQGGDKYNRGSPTILHYNRGYEVYTKTRPYEWNPDNKGGGPFSPVYSDVIVEQWVSFGHKPNIIKVKYRITSLSNNFRKMIAQESPCVYTNSILNKFVIYEGNSPWSYAPLSYYNLPVHPQPALYKRSTEYWAALINESSNIGVGIYSSKHYYAFHALGFPAAANTAYFRGDRRYSIHSYGVIEDELYIIVGTLENIRRDVYEIHSMETFEGEWNFDNTYNWNEMWYAIKHIDNINITSGLLIMNSTGVDPFLRIMYDLGVDSSLYKTLEIRMYVSQGNYGAIYFTTLSDPVFNEQKKVSFRLRPGTFEVYRIDLSASPNWRGTINGFRLDPTDSPAQIKIDYIKFVVASVVERVPLYRLWSSSLSDHMYTSDNIEKNWATTIGPYYYENIAGYILNKKYGNSLPIYYLYHPAGDSLYTINDAERRSAISIGYVYIGIIGYAIPTQLPDTVPMYRMYNVQTVDHFYTTSWDEVEYAKTQGYEYEGIGFYVYISAGPVIEKHTSLILVSIILLLVYALRSARIYNSKIN